MDLTSIASLILSGVLVVITGIYAWLTYLIAERTQQSATAALSAAQASERAAEASQRMATLAEATLSVSFQAAPDRHSDGKVWITLAVQGANVWVHTAAIEKGIIVESRDSVSAVRSVPPAALEVIGPDEQFPIFLQAGSPTSLSWPESPFTLGDWGCGFWLTLEYSLTRDGGRIRVTDAFEKPKDLYDLMNEKTKFFPDRLTSPAGEVQEPEADGQAESRP